MKGASSDSGTDLIFWHLGETTYVWRLATTFLIILGGACVSVTAPAQISSNDFDSAKEKLKAALQEQNALANRTNDFDIADYNRFHDFDVRMRPIADDLAAVMMRPSPGNAEGSFASAARTRQCTIQLAGNFEAVRATLNGIGNLVELAAKMVHGTDMTFVSAVLSVEVPAFLEQLKSHQQMLDLTLTSAGCSQDGATVAKGQEISRLYGDAAALVQSMIEKIGAGAPK
jgi:hypothetical protein